MTGQLNETLLQLAGRLHPMVLHLPIGVLVALVVLELWARIRGRPLDRGARLGLLWLLVVTAGISVGSGILLSEEPGYAGDAVLIHRWLGIVTGAAAFVAAAFATVRFERGYRALLFLAALLVIPTGHFGAGMTHGKGFLTAPFVRSEVRATPERAAAADPPWYASRIAPILETHCTGCHGATRRKSGLALHTAEAIIQGGAGGSVITADGDGPGALLRRIRLPLTDDEHMPPEGKPQLSAPQIETIARWIGAGAPIDTPAPDEAVVVEPSPATPPRVPHAIPRQTLADLHAAHVHAEVIDPETDGLWIDFTAVPDLPVDEIVRLLEPLAAFTAELSLRGVTTANAVLIRCGPWARLRRLDLSNATVDRDGLAAAAESGHLAELTLIGTDVTAEAAETLTGLESLEVLHVWGSNLSAGALASLRARRPGVVNDGSIEAPPPVEVEPAFEFGKPRGVAASLEPVNSKCPVTGAPVDARFAIVHDGKVIAFCCNACPGRFWDDPDAFPVDVGETKEE